MPYNPFCFDDVVDSFFLEDVVDPLCPEIVEELFDTLEALPSFDVAVLSPEPKSSVSLSTPLAEADDPSFGLSELPQPAIAPTVKHKHNTKQSQRNVFNFIFPIYK